MEHTDVGRTLSGLYRTTFETGISTMNAIQDYTEKMVNLSLEQSPWIPEENRKLVLTWVKTYRKGYDDFRVAVTEQFKHLDSLLNMGCIGGSFTDTVTEQFKHFNPLLSMGNIGASFPDAVTEQFKFFNPLYNLEDIQESIANTVKRSVKKTVKGTVKGKSKR
jgi:hypothetical protein